MIFLGHFLLFDLAWSELNQATVTFGSLNNQDMIGILKQSRYDFSGKYLYGGYCNGYYVMFMCGGQHSTEGHMVF